MEALGFNSFQAELRRQVLFSSNEERVLHNTLVTEVAKEKIGNGPLHSTRDDGPFPDGWESPILRDLRAQRYARMGVRFRDRDPNKNPGWTMELDPCRRRVETLEGAGAPEYKSALPEIKEFYRKLRAKEVSRISTDACTLFDFTEQDRLRFYAYTCNRLLEPYGYSLDRKKSGKTKPVFSKVTKEGWRLSWALAQDLFLVSPNPALVIHCYILPKKASAADLRVNGWNVVMPHEFAAPLSYLFGAPYAPFNSIRELEVNIAARVAAYGLINEFLEQVLQELRAEDVKFGRTVASARSHR